MATSSELLRRQTTTRVLARRGAYVSNVASVLTQGEPDLDLPNSLRGRYNDDPFSPCSYPTLELKSMWRDLTSENNGQDPSL